MPSSAHWAFALACATASCSSDSPLGPPSEPVAETQRNPAKPNLLATAGQLPTEGFPNAAGAAGTAGVTGGVGAAGAVDPPSCKPNRAVLTSELRNARDLGGTPLGPGKSVACGAFYRGPPLRLLAAGCAEADELGFGTIIDLRIEGERTSTPDADCAPGQRVFAPLPVPYGLGPTDYLKDLQTDASIALAFHTFGNADAYPVYFHCTFGRDRTGVVGALLLLALGATRAAVMQEYLLSQPFVGAYPNSLDAVLDEVEQRKGAEAVLQDIGITPVELAVMRDHIVVSE